MFRIELNVTKKAWMSDPAIRWNAGLERGGFNFRTGLSRSHYPPLPPSGDHRTYATAAKADYNIVEVGRVMEFGSTYYLPFLLFGTRHMVGWPGKAGELIDLLQSGFRSGVAEFSG